MDQNEVTIDFIHRELAVELGLSPALLKDITDRLFRKVTKYLLRGRPVNVKGFGKFTLQYRRPKPVPQSVQQKTKICDPRIVPQFKFKRQIAQRIQESLHDLAVAQTEKK